jgi:predicted  nucleic acid-binding Zn-ribbon protein
MPHVCTRCNNILDSGEDILKGCPVCGSKKFMFMQKRGKAPRIGEISQKQSDHLITPAMGVRIPPRRTPKKQTIEPAKREVESQIEDLSGESAPIQSSEMLKVPLAAPPDESEKTEDEKLESIKITAPGTYELNLPSLFTREELIMAVKEGTYLIDLSSAFRKGKKE